MKVSVIIPAYNEEKYIQACLESLMKQTEKPDEILVVDNNSTDQTAAIAKNFPEVKVVKEKRQGITWARNKGFNTAKYEIIARTDADTRVPKDWIKKIKKHFKSPKVIAVSGPARFYEGLPDMVQVDEWPSKVLFFTMLKQALQHDTLFGPNMALRKSIWEMVKDDVCLDDKEVHEDIDLSLHIAPYGRIKFDNKLIVLSSFRRWKKLLPYFEYPYRAIKTTRKHRQTLLERQSKKLMRRVISRGKTIVKHLQEFPHQLQ